MAARRTAYTLPELLIVLAILAALAGFALPAMRHPLDQGRLRSAARDVRTVLTKARAIAVREGQVVSFACESGGAAYRLVRSTAPTLPARLATQSDGAVQTASGLVANDPQPNEPETTESHTSGGMDHGIAADRTLWSGRLPEGVTFADRPSRDSVFSSSRSVSGNSSGDAHGWSETAESTAAGSDETPSPGETDAPQNSGNSTRWISGPEFLPNGRMEDFFLQLFGARGFRIDVRVRGLTGAVSHSAAYRRDDPDSLVPGLDPAESLP